MKHPRQNADLLGQVVVVDLLGAVQRRIHQKTRVVDGHESQRRGARPQNQFAVDRDLAWNKGLPAHPAFRADAVDQHVFALVAQFPADLAGVVHEVLAKGGEVALVVKTRVAVPDAQFVGLRREVQADEELDSQRVDLGVHPLLVELQAQILVVDQFLDQFPAAGEALLVEAQLLPLLAHDPFLDSGSCDALDEGGILPRHRAHQPLLAGEFLATDPIEHSILFDHLPGQGRLDDPANQHAVDEGILSAHVALDEVVDTAQPQMVRRGGQKDDRARRRVFAEIAGQFDQPGDARRLLGSGTQGRHHRHRVVVRLQDDDVLFHQRIIPRDDPQQVPGRTPLPHHAILHVYFLRSAGGELATQSFSILFGNPEAGKVERHGQKLLLPFQIHRRIRLDEDHGSHAQISAVEPRVARIEIHQHDGALHLLAVEMGVVAVAGVDHPSRNTSLGQGRGFHQIGPQPVEPHLLTAGRQFEKTPLFNRNRDIVFVHGDIVQTDIPEGLLYVMCGFLGPGITDHLRLQAGKIAQSFLHALDGHRPAEFGKVHLGTDRRQLQAAQH